MRKFTHRATQPNGDMVAGWAEASLGAWAHSINYGLVEKNGRSTEKQLLDSGVSKCHSNTM